MTFYENLLQFATDCGLVVHEEVDLGNGGVDADRHLLGLCVGDQIGLARELETDADRSGVLAEEICHALFSVGNILDQDKVFNRQQERKDRLRSYDLLFGIDGIAKAIMDGCANSYEMAEYLGINEKTLLKAIDLYHSKYGQRIETDDYDLYFEPCLMVVLKGE